MNNPNKRPPPSSSAGTFEGGDGTKRSREAILRPGKDAPSNVLLVRISDIVHPVTIVALQQIFSRFGKVDKIVMFDKGSGSQALVQMADVHMAMSAHGAADMQEMYSGGPYPQNYVSRGGGRGGGGDDSNGPGGASGSNGIGGGGGGTYSRPPPAQPSGNYYPPSANVMPSPQGAPYGGIPFSSERSPPGGFGSLGMGGGAAAARPMPNSGRPGRGGGAGGPGVGGLGGGGGGASDAPARPCTSARQREFSSSDEALTAAATLTKKSGGRHPNPEENLEGEAGRKRGEVAAAGEGGARANGDDKGMTGGTRVGLVKGAGSNGAGGKNANKREAAEMLGPDATDQLAAATAKVFLGKRTNKREAAEMLGPDATDQLAAATAKVRVSDDGDGEEVLSAPGKDGEVEVEVGVETEAVAGSGAGEAGGRPDESKRKASAVAGDDEDEKSGGKRTAGVDGGGVGDAAAAVAEARDDNGGSKRSASAGGKGEGNVEDGVATEAAGPRRGGFRSGAGSGGKNDVSLEDETKSGTAEVTEDQEKAGVASQDDETGGSEKGDKIENGGVEDYDVESEANEGEEDNAEPDEDEEEKTEPGEGEEKAAHGEGEDDGEEPEEKKTEPRVEADCKPKNVGSSVDGEKDGEGDEDGDGVGEGEEEADDGAEDVAKVKDDDDDDDAGREAEEEEERVDVGAWAAAASAARSPINMVRQVDPLEVSPGALCHLFGLYGDVMKVKLVASRGMALVQMRYPVQAVNAQRLLDQTPLSGMILEVKASSQWSINDPTATDFSEVEGLHRYATSPSPEDKRYRDSLSPPCATLVVDNLSPEVSAEDITPIFAKHGAVSSVDLDTHAEAPLDAGSTLPSAGGSNPEPSKPSVQALVHMEANGKVCATEAAVHALIMTHNLTLAERRLRVSFLSGERHVEK
eukprot:g18369.t2